MAGLFGRLGNLWRGFLSIWISDVEKAHPEIAYEKILFRYLAKEALALCCFRAGRFAESARMYRQAAQAHPDPQACEVKARLADLRAAT